MGTGNRIPKNRIPKELTQGIYTPELVFRDVNLNEFVREAELPARQERAKNKVINQIKGNVNVVGSLSAPVPLTEDEAIAADQQIAATIDRIAAARQRLTETRGLIEKAINDTNGGKELSFKMDISKKQRVKRAIRKLFGKKTDTITFSMYKELLKAKYTLESREIEDFSKGKLKDE